MKEPKLSKRLSAIVELAAAPEPCCGCIADVGCDHGWIAITLILKGLAKKVIASDLRQGPLDRARQHIAEYELEDRISAVLAGGLEHISKEEVPDGAVIAGMGGYLITDILKEAVGRQVLPRTLILQPQNGWERVREYLAQEGYEIEAENMVKEDGKYYTLLRAVRSDAPGALREDTTRRESQREECLAFGRLLLRDRHPVLKEYLLKEKAKYAALAQKLEKHSGNYGEIVRKLRLTEKALLYWEM